MPWVYDIQEFFNELKFAEEFLLDLVHDMLLRVKALLQLKCRRIHDKAGCDSSLFFVLFQKYYTAIVTKGDTPRMPGWYFRSFILSNIHKITLLYIQLYSAN